MPIKPIGWICGQVLKNFSGRIEGIQKTIMDLVDEFKDDISTIPRVSQSNQKRETMKKPSKVKMAIALAKINRRALIQGLNSISRSSKSVAKLLQPRLACRLLELRCISHRLLREVNAPKQPLYNTQAGTPSVASRWKHLRDKPIIDVNLLLVSKSMLDASTKHFLKRNDHLGLRMAFSRLMINISKQIRKGSLFDIISFPAKTALTSIMYASYAALIYLTVCVNAVLEKVKKIFQEEESIRQNREESKHLRKSFSEPALSEPMFPDGEIKVKSYCSLLDQPDNISDFPDNMLSNKIQVLHSVFDQSTEINE